MFTKLFAAVTTVVAATAPALASPAIQQRLDQMPLLDAVQATGTSVWYNTNGTCDRSGVMGSYQVEWDTNGRTIVDQMNICIDNHQGDVAELMNTIRHEAVHVMQACKGGVLAPPSYHAKYASADIKRAVGNYPPEKRAKELEAWTMAAILTNEQIRELLMTACKN